jgi:hypothetical protein
MEKQQPTASRTCVEWVAGHIDDPVVRLRFLKTVAPPAIAAGSARRRLLIRLSPLVLPVLLGPLFLAGALGRIGTVRPLSPPALPRVILERVSPEIWLVESAGESETYSNGLRIDNRFSIRNHPRSYLAFPAGPASKIGGVGRTEPAGIVFHTTESRQAPFEAAQNGPLKRIGESLLEYVRRKRAYHFLIDRFGRVYRVVAESDAANHAGYSVWADEKWSYVNLNESFLGVSFETDTSPGQLDPAITPGQERAAAMLTEMLRGRYRIPAANCVTHAQVSVNPANMRIGYHTDWASSFPFERLGLPDNYVRPLPSLAAFGFEYDPSFLHWAGSRLYAGVELAEDSLQAGAARSGRAPSAFRRLLQKQYHERLAEVRRFSGNAAEAFEEAGK